MMDSSRHRLSDKQAYQFLQLMIKVSARTTAPSPEDEQVNKNSRNGVAVFR